MDMHTPEPWATTQRPNEIAIWAPGTPVIARVDLRFVSVNQWKANASLIVASPAMLGALRKAKAHIERAEDADDMAETLEAIDAAIAQATGNEG